MLEERIAEIIRTAITLKEDISELVDDAVALGENEDTDPVIMELEDMMNAISDRLNAIG